MLSEEEKDNVFKISVPIFTNEELERLDYTIVNDLDNIVHKISETVSKDRDIIIFKKIIEKQSKEIEKLKEKNFELEYLDTGKIMENKIKAKIEELEDINSKFSQRVIKAKEVYLTEMVQNILKELLEESK